MPTDRDLLHQLHELCQKPRTLSPFHAEVQKYIAQISELQTKALDNFSQYEKLNEQLFSESFSVQALCSQLSSAFDEKCANKQKIGALDAKIKELDQTLRELKAQRRELYKEVLSLPPVLDQPADQIQARIESSKDHASSLQEQLMEIKRSWDLCSKSLSEKINMFLSFVPQAESNED